MNLDSATIRSRAGAFHASVTAALAGVLQADDRQRLETVSRRLERSVLRPLDQALARDVPGGGEPPPAADAPGPQLDAGASVTEWLAGDAFWDLTRAATRALMTTGQPAELAEAAACLQDLACQFEPPSANGASARLDELEQIQAELPSVIRAERNGPYLVTNPPRLVNWLGEPVPTRPQMALCRCGKSATKPLCDGTHAEIGFSDEKQPERVPDRRDTYVGQQVTVFDNRGLCQHSGYCTDRLATVFRQGQEPFVAPSGGRMDEIIRAVRDCPSGALSFAIDQREAREQVDFNDAREPTIEITKDGPYRVRGSIPLSDDAGATEPRNQGASLEHYALCRCGHSQNKPFCSGMHWYTDFKDPVADPDHEPTVFEWIGGLPALTRMTRIFYEKYVPGDPLLAPVFANMSADHPERVAAWLSEVFGGPKLYGEPYGGYTRMISQHLGKGITEEKRGRWVKLLLQSARDAGLPNDPEFQSVFSSYVEWGSRLAVENSTSGAHPPEHMPMPHWEWSTAAGPPGSRISALATAPEPEAEPVVLPGPNEPVGFEAHIRALFRPRDRQSMKFAFDLGSYDDVKQHAGAILQRLQNGTMPCDGAWAPERVAVFERWVDAGAPE